jgi:hypothetical protein
VSERYLSELAAELGAVGIHGSRRRRILAETADHLRESGDATAFGEPRLIAAGFADELATNGARRVAFTSFLALAPAGLAYALLLGLIRTWPDIASARLLPLAIATAVTIVLAPQVALVAGVLAVARAWRLRSQAAAPAAEIVVLRRRAAVALGSGAAAFAGIGTYAYLYASGLPGWWSPAAFVVSGAALVSIGGAAVALARNAQLRPQATGPVGDLFDDLAPLVDRIPLRLRGRPWRFCLLVAVAVAAAAFIAGGPDEGPRNAVAEFVAVCAAFAVLGRFLGLRR